MSRRLLPSCPDCDNPPFKERTVVPFFALCEAAAMLGPPRSFLTPYVLRKLRLLPFGDHDENTNITHINVPSVVEALRILEGRCELARRHDPAAHPGVLQYESDEKRAARLKKNRDRLDAMLQANTDRREAQKLRRKIEAHGGTRAAWRELAVKYICLWPDRSDRVLAEVANVSRTTIGKLRYDLERAGRIPQFDLRVGRDGATHSAKKLPPPQGPQNRMDSSDSASSPKDVRYNQVIGPVQSDAAPPPPFSSSPTESGDKDSTTHGRVNDD